MNGQVSNFVIVLSALLLGVFFRSFFSIPVAVLVPIALFFVLVAILIRKRKFLILVFFVFLGFGWHSYFSTDMCSASLDSFVGEDVVIEGVVSSESARSGLRQSFILRPEKTSVIFRGAPINLNDYMLDRKQLRCLHTQRFKVSTDAYPELFYGDLVKVSGRLQKPENFITDFDREFDYVSYLGKDDIYYNISFADVEIDTTAYRGGLRRSLFKIKRSFLEKLQRFVPEPESALLGGILLGEKQSLGRDLEGDFISTGLIHIVVLSGYNVSIVAEAIAYVLAFLPRAFAYGSSSLGILLFMVLTGANAPIVRASIMAILLLVARFFGRPTEAGRMLLLAATIMVLINPSILVDDVSFHLSFLATLGLLYIFPIVDGFFSKWVGRILGLREIASATVSTQIAVLPYLVWKIGALSVVSPITNIVVLPFIPLSMFLGFLTGLLGYVFQPAAAVISYLSYGVLHIVIVIVKWFANLPFSLVVIPEIPLVLILVIYLLLGYYIFIKYKHD